MIDAATLSAALRDGALLGMQYNPLYAVVTAALAAAVWGYPKVRRDKRWYALVVLAVGWLAGDGLRVLARMRDYFDRAEAFAAAGLPVWDGWATLGTWAVVSLLLGYVLPALVGGAVGRRVTHGTGWLAAAAIASALVLAGSAAVGAIG